MIAKQSYSQIVFCFFFKLLIFYAHLVTLFKYYIVVSIFA